MKKSSPRIRGRGSLFEHIFIDSDFPFCIHMSWYAIRILRAYGINEQMLGYVLSCMSLKERRKIVNVIYQGRKSSGKMPDEASNLSRVMAGLCRPWNIDDEILSDILDGKTAMDEDAAVRVLVAWLCRAIACSDRKALTGLEGRSDELKKTFGLDDRDISLLFFLCCTYAVNMDFLKDMQSYITYSSYLKLAAVATGLPHATVHDRLSSKGMLFRTGIIESMDTLRPEYYIINDNIADFLSGSSDRSLIEKSIRLERGRAFDIDSFGIDRESVGIIRGILSADRPVNILLHGTAGTGKTEFARSVAASTGKKVYFLNHRPEYRARKQGGADVDPLLVLNVAGNSVPADRGIIIVDEADYILNTEDRFSVFSDTVEKGVLNSFLDRSRSQMIWISNRVTNMEESTLRRFSYSLHFRAYTSRERENIWNAILAGHPLRKDITPDLVKKLSLDYRVNAGSIASALEAAVMLFRGKRKSSEAVENCLRRLLDRHQEMIHRDYKKRKKLHNLTDKYDVASLNMDMSVDRVVGAVSGFSDDWKEISITRDANINLLFWGPPGTGKTEFAKYLAEKAGMRLVVRRYSDLESMWVGQTEKNIAAAFEEAEESKAILFIDEADSFFTSRASADRSWEVSRTNEFLTQMENHRGIFICCTNLLPSMDEAAMRRFHIKVRFHPLTADGKERLFRIYFLGKNEKLSPELAQKIRSIEGLTPGDFKAIRQKLVMSNERRVSCDRYIEELAKESSYKNFQRKKNIGF